MCKRETPPFANQELLFPGLSPGKVLIACEFWLQSTRASRVTTGEAHAAARSDSCSYLQESLVLEKNFSNSKPILKKMTSKLKIYISHINLQVSHNVFEYQ